MNKIGFCTVLSAAVFMMGDLGALSYPPLTNQQSATFQGQLDQAISKAEKDVQLAEQKATRTDMAPTWNSKLEMQNAIIQLEVKKTLYNNFKGTESLRSPLVREKLLKILHQSVITTADLADLQNLVLEEKAKIRAEDAQSTAPTSKPTRAAGG